MAELHELESRLTQHIIDCPVQQDTRTLIDRVGTLEGTLSNGLHRVVVELERDVKELKANHVELRRNQARILWWIIATGAVSAVVAPLVAAAVG